VTTITSALGTQEAKPHRNRKCKRVALVPHVCDGASRLTCSSKAFVPGAIGECRRIRAACLARSRLCGAHGRGVGVGACEYSENE
jgi:hypothetical protein